MSQNLQNKIWEKIWAINGKAYYQDILPTAQHKVASSISEPTGSAMAKVRQIEAYYFYFNQLGQDFGWGRTEEGEQQPRQVGLIAQELMNIEPSLVDKMDWLKEDGDYYRIDYEHLNTLLLDALNELNERADNVKRQLGMEVDVYPERASTTTEAPMSYGALQANPILGTEGATVTFTINGTNIPDGTHIGFKLSGTCNFNDIALAPGQIPGIDCALSHWQEDDTIEGNTPEEAGWAFGYMSFENDVASVTFEYTLDNTIEGQESIVMTLRGDSLGNELDMTNNNFQATAYVSDK